MDDDKKHSPDSPPPGTVGAGGPARDVLPPGNIMPHVQMIGRGKRKHGGKMADMLAQSSRVVDYAGSKTGRFDATSPKESNTPKRGDDPSLVEQLARRLETFADDNDAMASRRRLTITDAREMKSAAHTFRSSATELRDAMTAQNKALYQVEINTILERFGVPETVKDEISLAIVKEFMG